MENFRLKVFRVVARHLNFSRAAEELLLTQPIKEGNAVLALKILDLLRHGVVAE